MEAGGDRPKKVHKKKASGVKAKKKRDKDGQVERHNAKAHTFSGGAKSVHRRVLHSLERVAKRERAPRVDKNPENPPPFVVVVQGPPGVGKSTLIQSLVRHYAKQRLIKIGGPVTLVSSRQRRITIIECPQDMATMLDLAKVADLVMLLVDASYGFELETFEFINILQVHGFPRIIGVLTHLDGYKDNKQLRKVKKMMKHRFWSECFEGAKLFYLSGLQYGRYPRLEIANLARFVTVQRAQILSWRQSHPYVLGLRWEDHTDPTLPASAPRRLDIYGYVYGGRLREGTQAHLAGIGDFFIAQMKRLPDPCPAPDDVESARNKAKEEAGQTAKGAKAKVKNALRTLAERHRLVYAPGSDVGSITVDSEGMYITVAQHEVGFTKKDGEAEGDSLPEAVRLVRALQSGEASLDKATASRPALRLVGSSTVRLPQEEAGEERKRRPAPGADVVVDTEGGGAEGDDEGEEEENGEGDESEAEAGGGGDAARDSDEEYRKGVMERARQRFSPRFNLERAIYGDAPAPEEKMAEAPAPVDAATDHKTVPLFDDDEEDEAAKPRGRNDSAAGGRPWRSGLLGNLGDLNGLDTSRMPTLPGETDEWDEERKADLKTRKFITGGWSSAEEDEDGEPKQKAAENENEPGDKGAEGENAEGEQGGEGGAAPSAPTSKVTRVQLDPSDNFQDGAPIAAFVRVRLEDVPAACVEQLRRDRLLLLGGLLPGESQQGLVQVRVKRHRWHPKLLKSNDALLVSVGWRRYQTVPTFSLEDRGEKRMRFLKYTLEHAHCTMTMYGPMVPPNAGVMAFRSWKKVDHFRVAATGGVLESAPNFNIVKKLKLVGEPYKIFKNTAFVKGMFNSDLEVAKYSHAKIQTVSGIRGEIKKAEGVKGSFRATFEDRILMSDLVVCKTWVPVEPRQFYHPVVDIAEWRAAKLIGELRAERGIPVPNNRDSQYGKQIERAERKFNKIKIPKALEAALPFKTRNKVASKKAKDALRKKAAVVSSEREHEINSLMNRLLVVRKEKKRIRTEASQKKKTLKEKREKFIQDKRDAVTKEVRKKRYIKQGNEEARRRKALRLD